MTEDKKPEKLLELNHFIEKSKTFKQLNVTTIGVTIDEIHNLSYGGYDKVVVESDDELDVPSEFYVLRTGGVQNINPSGGKETHKQLINNHIFRRPKSYVNYVRYEIESLIEFPDEKVELYSFGKPASERSAINQVSESLRMRVRCNFDRAYNTFTVRIADNKPTPNIFTWWDELSVEPIKITFEGVFTNFRAKVYRVAKVKGMKVQVTRPSGSFGEAYIRIVAEDEPKSFQSQFNEFLSSIPVGESKQLPVEFPKSKSQYLRTLMSNHKNPYSFREGVITHVDKTKPKSPTDAFTKAFVEFLDSIPFGETKPLPEAFTFANVRKMKTIISHHVNPYIINGGQVNHGHPAPHINGIGCFIMNGKNWGKRTPEFINLKLRKTDYNYEDIK